MYGQRLQVPTISLWGNSARIRSVSPHSVTSMNRRAGEDLMYATMFSVPPAMSECAITSGAHSVWARIFASGYISLTAVTFFGPNASCTMQRPPQPMIFLEVKEERFLAMYSSGRNKTSSWGTALMIFRALADVQQTSLSALTSAEVLTYTTTAASGCFLFNSRTSSAVMDSESEQPASEAGKSTVFSGFKILAVSAMNRTPENTRVSAWVSLAFKLRPYESPTKSAMP